ncbi:unnamed protein product, partial [Owenia fusiformis]
MADETSLWKKKYETSEFRFGQLKRLANKAVGDYEDLKRRYEKLEEQKEELIKRLNEAEELVGKSKNVLEHAYAEYSELDSERELAAECSKQAENYAKQVVKENKSLNKQNKYLKRQSQAILMKYGAVDIPLDDPIDQEKDEAEKEDFLEDLRARNEALEKENAESKRQIRELTEQVKAQIDNAAVLTAKHERERAALLKTQKTVAAQSKSLKQFQRVSMMAYSEFNDLREKYETEQTCREEAERFASKMFSQKNAMARESQIVLNSVASDKRLMDALNDIDKLTQDLEKEKKEKEIKIQQLRELLDSNESEKNVSRLEEQVTWFTEQQELLQKQLMETERKASAMEEENRKLISKMTKMEEDRLKPPVAPPPPPIPAPTLFTPLRKMMQNKKKKILEGNQVPVTPQMNDVLKDMMKRIKDGEALLKTRKEPAQRRPSEPIIGMSSKAFDEMGNMLSMLRKRSRSSGDIMETVENENSELAEKLNARRK